MEWRFGGGGDGGMHPRRPRTCVARPTMSRPHCDPSAAPIASRAAGYRDTEMIGATFGTERKQRLDDAPSVGHAGRDRVAAGSFEAR